MRNLKYIKPIRTSDGQPCTDVITGQSSEDGEETPKRVQKRKPSRVTDKKEATVLL